MTNATNSVDVWVVPLEGTVEAERAFASVLSAEELSRAARFRRPELQTEYVLSHGVLRTLLDHYSGIPAREIRYGFGTAGKPHLTPAAICAGRELQFNMSHSGSLALYGITDAPCLGVDVEQMRELTDMEAIADQFFAPGECADLRAMPPKERTQGFFRCWTRKEAFLKATGDGLSVPLDRFRVEFRGKRRPALLEIPHECVIQDWQIENIDAHPDYAASVVYPGPRARIQIYGVRDAWEVLDKGGPKKLGANPSIPDRTC
jgi:4'-phosphopantetheinyl transferase